MPTDKEWMNLALAEARKGVGLTAPNPPVGAVIVKDGQLLGKGWHQRVGEPHAEREAFAAVIKSHGTEALLGATIYVTLEPCSTVGRTPACTDGIIKYGISRVVYASLDVNPQHAGRADTLLRDSGVEVCRFSDTTEADYLIRAFSKVQQTGLPWVILKSAMSLDGQIMRPPGESQWLTSSASRKRVQQMRHSADAILTGGQTVRADDPALTVRDVTLPAKPQPWRMIVSQKGRQSLPADAQVFTDDHAERTLVQENGDLHSALTSLVEKGCNTVLVEAGGTLMSAFLEKGLVDELALFYAPLLTGATLPAFTALSDCIPLSHQSFEKIGSDILLTAHIDKAQSGMSDF